jgi:acyl carrier protein
MKKKKSKQPKKLTHIAAKKILYDAFKENFSYRKDQSIANTDGSVTFIPGFPKRIKLKDKLVEDLGLDSLDLTEVGMDVEEKFAKFSGVDEIYFDAEDLKSLSTVDDVIKFFVKAVNEKPSLTKEEIKEKVKEKYNFRDMGLKEDN